MRPLCFCTSLLLAISATTQDTAPAPCRLQIDGASPALTAVLTTIRKSLAEGPPTSAFAVADRVLGQLRLGDLAGSRASLSKLWTPSVRTASADDRSWAIVTHTWHLRATHDRSVAEPHLAQLLAMGTSLAEAPCATTFADESMRIHALFCIGMLVDELGQPRRPGTIPAGAEWTALAVDRQLELERRAWQPGRGHFRSVLTNGDLMLPERPNPSLLLPAASGLLIASGDRLLRHLRGALHGDSTAENAPSSWAELAPALRLSTAVQLDDESLRRRCWQQLLRDPVPPRHAGFTLEAICFAITGVRIATGAGLDEQWLRLRPWLPPGTTHLHLRGVLAHGTVLDFDLAQAADDEGTLHLTLTAEAEQQEPLPVVVGSGSDQTIGELRAGEPLRCSLVRRESQAKHDAQPIGGELRR